MMLHRAVVWVSVLSACLSPAVLPHGASAQATGTIQGHVYGSDTNEPIRAAHLVLKSAKNGEEPPLGQPGEATGEVAMGNSHLDGSFSFSHLQPGRYFIYATAPGYLEPSHREQVKQQASPAKQERDQSVALNPVEADVVANQTVQVNFQLERGAAVEGRVLFDDGSPMAGAQVTALKMDSTGKWKELPRWQDQIAPDFTNDLGYYRIAGLPAGKYLVEADLRLDANHVFKTNLMDASRTSLSFFSIYSGSSFEEKDATPFKLTRGEDRTGEDLTFRASALHRVSGVVVAQEDGHPIPDAKVEIDTADGQAVDSTEVLDASGAFQFEFVPEGHYTIKVSGARDVDSHGETVRRYGGAQQPLILENDTTGLSISVPPLK